MQAGVDFREKAKASFKVICFFTGTRDLAHVSFIKETIPGFKKVGSKHRFTFDTTSNLDNMNPGYFKNYQVIVSRIPVRKNRNRNKQLNN